MSVLYIEINAGDTIQIGDARITLVEKSGRRARLTIHAPASTPVARHITPPSAQECAPSPPKERHHGQYPV